MRKILFIMLALVLAACSSDDDHPINGKYIARKGNLVICMYFDNGRCDYIAPFVDGQVTTSWRQIHTTGVYPDYTYRTEDFTMTASFTDSDNFTATLVGTLKFYVSLDEDIEVNESGLQFKTDNTVLDANGDGILDSVQ
jgi:hypothetical protein